MVILYNFKIFGHNLRLYTKASKEIVLLEVRKQQHSFVSQCGSVVERNAQVKRQHLGWRKFDSFKGYATLKSSNESETRVWCFLFLVWLTILNNKPPIIINIAFYVHYSKTM